MKYRTLYRLNENGTIHLEGDPFGLAKVSETINFWSLKDKNVVDEWEDWDGKSSHHGTWYTVEIDWPDE